MSWFGATSTAGDDGLEVRAADHVRNLERLSALLGGVPSLDVGELAGRAGVRWSSADRLPIVGAVPLASMAPECLGDLDRNAMSPRPEHPRFAPRAPGLFVVTALGSRGIAWSALAARCVVSAITGAPAPIEADLLDAVDPARFASRAWRAAQATAGERQPPDGPIAAGSAGS
jgi:tRNA 5-methylaminomethyl-2-thiouridine biosynthesis bifunctional protein